MKAAQENGNNDLIADVCGSGVTLSAAWSKRSMPYLYDLKSGVTDNVYFFQAALGESKLPYMEAFPGKEEKYWVRGLINAVEYYGGLPAQIAPLAHNAPRIPGYLSPANVRDSAFGLFSEFYGIPILPVNEKNFSQCLVADNIRAVEWMGRQLKEKMFYSIDALNTHISVLLPHYASLPSIVCNDSRYNVFCLKDKPLLKPLPEQRFSITDVCTRVAGDNCFIKYGDTYYSIPYLFCNQQVTLHASDSEIIIYDINGGYLATHKRGGYGKYVADPCHMPPLNQSFGNQYTSGEKYVQWARRVGRYTHTVILCLLTREKYEQCAFKTCMAILQLSKKYGPYRLESACKKAIQLGCVSYYSIRKLVAEGLDEVVLHERKVVPYNCFQPRLGDL